MAEGSSEGAKGEPFTMRVELGKIREFAKATRSSNPEYLEDDEATMPPTFLQCAGFWSTPGAQPPRPGGGSVDFSRLLHGGQEFTFYGPPPKAGDVLTCQNRLDKTYSKQGGRGGMMNFTETVMEVRDQTGKLVAESRSTSIITEKAPGS